MDLGDRGVQSPEKVEPGSGDGDFDDPTVAGGAVPTDQGSLFQTVH